MVIDTIFHARLPQWGSFDKLEMTRRKLGHPSLETALFSFEGTNLTLQFDNAFDCKSVKYVTFDP